jgi:hypothetical protein
MCGDVKTGEGREGSRRSGWPGNWHKWISQFAETEKIGSASAAGQNSANDSGGLRVCLIGVHAFVRQANAFSVHAPTGCLFVNIRRPVTLCAWLNFTGGAPKADRPHPALQHITESSNTVDHSIVVGEVGNCRQPPMSGH